MNLDLSLDRAVAGGRMLGRADGKVVLVAGGIPGERVRVEVERSASQVAFAHVIEVLEASPDRREPLSDPACGGLAYAHIQYERQCRLKSDVIVDAFRRLGRIELERPVSVAASRERGYRLRARLHVREGRAGFFREQSHDLCEAGPTGQLLPEALTAIAIVLDRLGPAANACEAVVIAENVPGTDRVLHLEPRPGRTLDVSALTAELPTGLTGITTTTVDGRTRQVAGMARVMDAADAIFPDARPEGLPPDVTWARGPESFFQGNRYLLGTLLGSVLAHVSTGPVIDVYAGVGLFAVAVAARGLDVLAVEGDRISVADLVLNARPYPKLEAHGGAVEQVLPRLNAGAFGTVLLDPPRTGLSKIAAAAVLRLSAPRMIYVSCDVATLARDAARLVAHGYQLIAVEAFDMFPNTGHIETLAVFHHI
jgi:23S rRNA (uracil1939-C5)-methyltransferase